MSSASAGAGAIEAAVRYTDPEAATLPEPELVSSGSSLPMVAAVEEARALDPAAAAFEAARIAGEIVGDIESRSGAAIVAAAAAGAAIQAARARRAAEVAAAEAAAAAAAAAASAPLGPAPVIIAAPVGVSGAGAFAAGGASAGGAEGAAGAAGQSTMSDAIHAAAVEAAASAGPSATASATVAAIAAAAASGEQASAAKALAEAAAHAASGVTIVPAADASAATSAASTAGDAAGVAGGLGAPGAFGAPAAFGAPDGFGAPAAFGAPGAMGASGAHGPGPGVTGAPGASGTAGSPPGIDPTQAADPVTTVRMQRERILRALAEDIAASPAVIEAGGGVVASGAAIGGALGAEGRGAYPRARTQPGGTRATSQAGVRADGGDAIAEDEDELDPVAIAAAAIQRLRQRASTDFAELRVHYHRHDIVVLLAAFLLILVAGWVHRGMVTPPNMTFEERGLVFSHSQAWLKGEDLSVPPPRIARDPTGQPPKAGDAYHVAFTSSVDPSARIEVLIDKKPQWSNIVTGLELDRRTRWGELYTLDDSSVREIGDQNWLRTAYRYAHAPDKGDVPRVDRAVEYATVDREQVYVVTLFGSESQLSRIESVIAPTLRVRSRPGSRSGLPLVPQERQSVRRTYPNPVARAFDSTVMIVVADMIDGRLVARGGGSGVIVGKDGSILTNYHVIHDKNGRLHDVYVIGRFSSLDRAPQLECAGRPSRSKLQRELDLALIKCDTDLDGRVWTPSSAGIWATLPEAKSSEVRMGQRLWVLGYPDSGGGGLTLSEGEVDGWTGQDGTTGRDFLKTDASITHGNSGGPVVDDQGRLVGIASASRTRVTDKGGVIESKQVGLVRPLSTAADLLAIADTGWTPREGHTDVELQPSAVEAPAEGVRIETRVIDAANEAPIRDALVMVLRPGVNASSIDVNRLDDQVLSWGRSNTQGLVQLKQPVPAPGTYTVMVVARGYEPLIGEDKLRLDDKAPSALDPWGGISLLAR
ncbi:MAG TPA: serine protease [Kofleriaceae bacterium]|nr:serine protease [Kofleriaceae bacterium]